MRVYLGSDHAGYELKVHLVNYLAKQGYDVVDVGPHVFDPDDDYPSFCLHTGARVVADAGCPWILMHWRGYSRDMDSLATYDDVVKDVIEIVRAGGHVDSSLAEASRRLDLASGALARLPDSEARQILDGLGTYLLGRVEAGVGPPQPGAGGVHVVLGVVDLLLDLPLPVLQGVVRQHGDPAADLLQHFGLDRTHHRRLRRVRAERRVPRGPRPRPLRPISRPRGR